jgi:elongation factor 1-beta
MGMLLARMKILPKEVGTDLKKMTSSIEMVLPKGALIRKVDEDPIAFGLVALLLDIQVEEKEGAVDRVEEAVKKAELVSEVEIKGISKLSTRVG